MKRIPNWKAWKDYYKSGFLDLYGALISASNPELLKRKPIEVLYAPMTTPPYIDLNQNAIS